MRRPVVISPVARRKLRPAQDATTKIPPSNIRVSLTTSKANPAMSTAVQISALNWSALRPPIDIMSTLLSETNSVNVLMADTSGTYVWISQDEMHQRQPGLHMTLGPKGKCQSKDNQC